MKGPSLEVLCHLAAVRFAPNSRAVLSAETPGSRGKKMFIYVPHVYIFSSFILCPDYVRVSVCA